MLEQQASCSPPLPPRPPAPRTLSPRYFGVNLEFHLPLITKSSNCGEHYTTGCSSQVYSLSQQNTLALAETGRRQSLPCFNHPPRDEDTDECSSAHPRVWGPGGGRQRRRAPEGPPLRPSPRPPAPRSAPTRGARRCRATRGLAPHCKAGGGSRLGFAAGIGRGFPNPTSLPLFRRDV